MGIIGLGCVRGLARKSPTESKEAQFNAFRLIWSGAKDMRLELDDYRDSATKGTVDFLYRLSDLVKGRSFLHVNAVRYGGGMAEILRRLVPMLSSLGVEARWEVLAGD